MNWINLLLTHSGQDLINLVGNNRRIYEFVRCFWQSYLALLSQAQTCQLTS